MNKTILTKDQIEFLLKAWKTMTLTQISEAIGDDSTSRVNTFYNKRGISPMTMRELIANELFKIRDSGALFNSINEIAKYLKTDSTMIKRAMDEYGIEIKTAPEINIIKEKILNDFDNSIIESKENRSKFSVYTQSGSELIDEVRGVKTTKREKTLVSNGKF